MESIILNEKSYTRFIENVQNKKYMIIWAYYNYGFNDETRVMLDICRTNYWNGEFALSARGITYFSLFNDQPIEKCSLEGLQKYIHSFIEIKEPKKCQ